MISHLNYLTYQPERPPMFVDRPPASRWVSHQELEIQNEPPKFSRAVARDMQLTFEVSEELTRFQQPFVLEDDIVPQTRTATALSLKGGGAVYIPHRTWYSTTDGSTEDSTFLHMATLLQWAILVSSAPEQTYALVSITKIHVRLPDKKWGVVYRYIKTPKWTTIFRSISNVRTFKQYAHQLHPLIEMVLNFAKCTAIDEISRLYDAHEIVQANLPIDSVIVQGGTELPQKPVPSGRSLPFGVWIQTFTQMLRNDLEAQETKRKLVARHQHFAEREAGAKNWLSGILQRAHLVQVIRLEFDFAPEVIKTGIDPVSNHLWKKFWNRVRHQSAAQHLLGRVWTKNWRKERGVTYRCLLILNANAEMADVQAFHDTWQKVLPGVTLPGEVHAQDPFKWLTPVSSEAQEDRDQLMRDVCLQGWMGWLLDIRGANPKETYGRSERVVSSRAPRRFSARARKGTCNDAALAYNYSAVMAGQSDQSGHVE